MEFEHDTNKLQLLHCECLESHTCTIASLLRTYTQRYARSEYHTAVCKDEFRRNLRSHRLIAGSGWIYLLSRGMEHVDGSIKRNKCRTQVCRSTIRLDTINSRPGALLPRLPPPPFLILSTNSGLDTSPTHLLVGLAHHASGLHGAPGSSFPPLRAIWPCAVGLRRGSPGTSCRPSLLHGPTAVLRLQLQAVPWGIFCGTFSGSKNGEIVFWSSDPVAR